MNFPNQYYQSHKNAHQILVVDHPYINSKYFKNLYKNNYIYFLCFNNYEVKRKTNN